jgi:hypothetical protein
MHVVGAAALQLMQKPQALLRQRRRVNRWTRLQKQIGKAVLLLPVVGPGVLAPIQHTGQVPFRPRPDFLAVSDRF